MSQQTKQAQAVAAAQSVADYMRQLAALHDQINGFLTTYAANSYDATWQALPTTVFASDGTVGTADGSPNNAHPISVPAVGPLLMARNDLLTAVGCLTNFQSFMGGVAVTTQANTPRKFADLLNK